MQGYKDPRWDEDDRDDEDDAEGYEVWPPDPDEDELSEELLTYEQQLILRRIYEDAQHMSRVQLIQALMQAWGEKFALRRAYMESARENDIPVRICEMLLLSRPETKQEFKEILGYVPTAQQAMDFLDELEETATMELDMERIVDSVE
jgi:hypothetical protein